MIALDRPAFLGRLPRLKADLGPLAGVLVLAAVILVGGSIFFHGFSENGFRQASRLAWRYASLIFFAALVAGPLCRVTAHFVPHLTPPESLSRRLVWGFAASYGVYLLSVFVPHVIELSEGATLMVLLGGGLALVMAGAAAPWRWQGTVIFDKVRRLILAAAALYFWLCYSVMALARLAGPHRPDAFYGISLCLMVAGLLARYADRWFSGSVRNLSNLRQLPKTAAKSAPN